MQASIKSLLVLAFAIISVQSLAQGYKIGDKVKDFTLVNCIDNSSLSLNSYAAEKGVVIIFTSNDCPFSKKYEDRIINLYKEFEGQGIKFILINPNNPSNSPEDTPELMIKKAQAKNYPFPYLIDNRKLVANSYGASRTPEAFVLKNINNSFVLIYKGAIDDNTIAPHDVSYHYLKNALTALVNNTPLRVTEKKATGCVIK